MSNNESEVERHAGIDMVPVVEWLTTNPETDDALIYATTLNTAELTTASKTRGS
jgi:hypothetical protein